MTKIAWVFPGQGSQVSGMGLDLLDHEIGKKRFDQASDILGWSVADKCAEADDILAKTLFTQPCLYTISSILVEILQADTENIPQPTVLAGHSLGEYVALFASGVFNFEAGLHLVKRRAELMDQASEGKMVALVGFDRDALITVIDQTEDIVMANDNHDGQVVLSGTPEAIDSVLAQIKVKRAIPLKVSGAFHSPLMSAAAAEYTELLNSVTFESAQIPVISNVEPNPTTDSTLLKMRIIQQMTGPVRWREISLQFNEMGIEEVVEVGPGKVLTGLVKRTCKGAKLTNISSFENYSILSAS